MNAGITCLAQACAELLAESALEPAQENLKCCFVSPFSYDEPCWNLSSPVIMGTSFGSTCTTSVHYILYVVVSCPNEAALAQHFEADPWSNSTTLPVDLTRDGVT
jgi:hypothetical protein